MTVLQSPESVVFSGDEELDLSSVKNVLSTALGFTIPETPRWSGMVVKNPFNFAEAAVVMAVGGTSQVMGGGGRSYSLRTDEPLRDTLRALQWRIEERFPTADNLTLVTVSLDDLQEAEKYFGDLTIRESPTLENLKTSVPEDKAFLDQIMLMDAITGKISSMGIKSDGIPDLYWFNLPGLHTLIDTYGEDSKQVLEAKRFLASSVLLLSDIFGTVYDEKVILVTLASDVAHTRRYKRTPPEEMQYF
ncbi:hypothetical protein AAG570_002628 [Ranatra chinensis]|uniref:Renin receptor N-terminal domain-containing protein n=1 Tax=Ranatra chinensis TaxID=642074 RepID=A0ABD0Y862_9HEMI